MRREPHSPGTDRWSGSRVPPGIGSRRDCRRCRTPSPSRPPERRRVSPATAPRRGVQAGCATGERPCWDKSTRRPPYRPGLAISCTSGTGSFQRRCVASRSARWKLRGPVTFRRAGPARSLPRGPWAQACGIGRQIPIRRPSPPRSMLIPTRKRRRSSWSPGLWAFRAASRRRRCEWQGWPHETRVPRRGCV